MASGRWTLQSAGSLATIERVVPNCKSALQCQCPDRKSIRPSLAQAAAASPRLPSSSQNPRPHKTSPPHDLVARTSTPQNITTELPPECLQDRTAEESEKAIKHLPLTAGATGQLVISFRAGN